MIRVVEIITDSNIGGAGRLLIARLKNSNKNRFQTIVVLPCGSLLVPVFSNIGIKTIEIHSCRDRSFDFFAIFELLVVLKKIKPHIVNCHGCLAGRIAARILNIPIKIYTRHCFYPLTWFKRSKLWKRVVGRLQCVLSDRVIAVADAAKTNLIESGVPNDIIEVIINGAEPIKIENADSRQRIKADLRISPFDTVVTICGRMETCKGQHVLLRSAKLLLSKEEHFMFLFVGGGSMMDKTISMARSFGIYEQCRFTGFVGDVTSYMNITDILVNCSIGTETSSLSLSEGMSIGIPIVASDYGGNPHMVKHGENGLIYPQNDPDALAENIMRLKNDREMYNRMSCNAKKRYEEEFRAEIMTRRTECLYEKLYSEKEKGTLEDTDSENCADKASN